jgi:hypothetical protein
VIRSCVDGYFRIAPVDLGIDFDVKDGSSKSGAGIQQDPYEGLPGQEWAIVPADRAP